MTRHPVVRVPSVYGGTHYVRATDLADMRKTYLPLYTRAGILWTDTKAGLAALRRHEATTLHRENIGVPD
jgi:hypothetical protein